VLWLQGFADQAMHTVELNIQEAQSIGHTLSLCSALVQTACPLALQVGDLAAAERFLALLLEHMTAHGLDVWRNHCRAFRAALLIARGDLEGGLPLLRTTVDALRGANFLMYHTAFLGALAESEALAGRLAEAETIVEEAIERCERREERWYLAELLRIKGEIMRQRGGPDAAAAKGYLLRAATVAEGQGALAWQLRCAMALARLQREEGRPDEARDQLRSVYRRFTEGFGTSDLRAARSLLEELGEF
jgi:predicted ATPase